MVERERKVERERGRWREREGGRAREREKVGHFVSTLFQWLRARSDPQRRPPPAGGSKELCSSKEQRRLWEEMRGGGAWKHVYKSCSGYLNVKDHTIPPGLLFFYFFSRKSIFTSLCHFSWTNPHPCPPHTLPCTPTPTHFSASAEQKV